MATVNPDDEHKIGESVTDLHDPVARENFRVVIIKPDEVEQLEMSDPAKARRWKYTFVLAPETDDSEGEGTWQVEELWP